MERIIYFLKNPIFLFIVFFFYGSILFGYLLSKIFYKEDIRKYGDGNPGTWNAFKVGGAKIGIPTLILDYSKGLIPSIITQKLYPQNSLYLIILSIAPILGHAFSPFLKFKGGKTMASSFGLWTALTLWEGPTLMGITTLISCSIQNNSSICSVLGFISLFFLLILREYPKEFLIIYSINLLIVLIKVKKDLFVKPKFKLRNPFKS
ncbi:MAG: glycerol-3-phosphate acyltransferase [Caldisericia bacterium]|nr:glycerol-3-phosphate acyltransferase [Caldisericia bacterium]